jgi:hypothetical protein
MQGLLGPDIGDHFTAKLISLLLRQILRHDAVPQRQPRRYSVGDIGAARRDCVDA